MQGNVSAQNRFSSMENRGKLVKIVGVDKIPMMTQNVDAMAGSLVNQGLLVENSKKTPSSEQLVHEQIQVADVSMDELVIIDLGGKEATTSCA
ncbi:hypothetical protein V6N11_044511 [Hibiscus sabdariffa]|uniref:Uncharacterized protein n=1 Tax=Hibiscus sabdariffa TaxID=183260 RepID=A0ABR2RFE6_9ROSI